MYKKEDRNQIDKELTIEIARIAKKMAGECVFCHGTGKMDNNMSCDVCARLRELAELCWHWVEWQEDYKQYQCANRSCGKLFDSGNGIRPDYTVQSIRAIMEELGELVYFAHTLIGDIDDWKIVMEDSHENGGWGYMQIEDMANEAIFDILTSDALMAQAVLSYLKAQNAL